MPRSPLRALFPPVLFFIHGDSFLFSVDDGYVIAPRYVLSLVLCYAAACQCTKLASLAVIAGIIYMLAHGR